MAKIMATDKELSRLRKKGEEVTPDSLRKLRAEMRKEEAQRAEKRNRKGMKAGPAVTEPRFAKGGYVNCGASVPASKKR